MDFPLEYNWNISAWTSCSPVAEFYFREGQLFDNFNENEYAMIEAPNKIPSREVVVLMPKEY